MKKQYIDKTVVKAEIIKRLKYNGTSAELDRSAFMAGKEKEDEYILTFLDTLEVEEEENTELLKVIDYLVSDKDDYTTIYAEKPHRGKTEWINDIVGKAIAKHFFEVGLKAKGE